MPKTVNTAKHVIRRLDSSGDTILKEWNPTDTSEEGLAAIAEAESILETARNSGSVIFAAEPGVKPEGPIRKGEFDPKVHEYQIHSQFMGG